MREMKFANSGPLFRFAYIGDLIRDFDIKSHIWVRVTKSLIECVILKGTTDFEVRALAFMLNHVVGKFLINTPLPEDLYKLKHILDVTNDTRDSDVAKAMFSQIVNYPVHFVLYADFNISDSALMPLIASRQTATRLVDAYR